MKTATSTILDESGVPFSRAVQSRSNSPENPATPLTDLDKWGYGAIERTSSAGLAITRETALTYSPWWRAINLICGDIAKTHLYVMRRNGKHKEPSPEHAAYQLLRYKPNSEMTAQTYWHTAIFHLLACGNSYSYIFRNGDGAPIELVPLNPDTTYPVRVGGVLHYLTSVSGKWNKLKASDVLHLKGLSFDGLVGYPVWQYARDSIAMGLAPLQFGARFFANGTEPRVMIQVPALMDSEAYERLKSSWNNLHAGLDNAHKVAILEQDAKLTPFSTSAKDSQLVEVREHQIRDCSNWTGVPPHRLGDVGGLPYNSMESANQAYIDGALDPRMEIVEQECRDKLLSEQEKQADTHVVKYSRQSLIRADMAAKAAYYSKALGGVPWMTVNEVRATDDMNPDADPMSDKLRIPLNVSSQTQPGDTPPPGDAPDVSAASRRIASDVAARMARRVSTQAGKASKSIEKFSEWITSAKEKNSAVMREALVPIVQVCRLITPAAAEILTDEIINSAFDLCRATMTEAASSRAETDQAIAAIIPKFERLFADDILRLCLE